MVLPCLRVGSGLPLVLIHGYLGGSAQWKNQIEAFSSKHAVIAFDLPGFGAAAGLSCPSTITEIAAVVAHDLDRLGIGSFALLGHSMGGMIVQEMAARLGDRITHLLLCGTGPLGLMPDRFEPLETSLARLAEDGVTATADRISATWFLHGRDASGYAPTRDIARLASPEAAHNALCAMRYWDGRDALTRLNVPTCILWGDRDRSYRWPQVASLWTGIPGASLGVIPGASHAIHMEKPQLFNSMVLDFLTAADLLT